MDDYTRRTITFAVCLTLGFLGLLSVMLINDQNRHATRLACLQAGLELTQVGGRLECKP